MTKLAERNSRPAIPAAAMVGTTAQLERSRRASDLPEPDTVGEGADSSTSRKTARRGRAQLDV
jgi:hypothetical protein